MQLVILAGGLGTRISEETYLKPKPMVEIGDRPILWHILKIYSAYGINDFIICCGYKGYLIKEYFANYFLHTSDITFHMDQENRMEVHQRKSEPWKVTLVDTGDSSQTGGRLKRVEKFIKEKNFCFTYGDGLSNVNIDELIKTHIKSNQEVTLTAVKPPGRFGAIKTSGNRIDKFIEKPGGDNAWINGGFFVCKKKVLNRITNDEIIWESDTLPKIAEEGGLYAFKHNGFWQPMDTLRDKKLLEQMWDKGIAPWKIW